MVAPRGARLLLTALSGGAGLAAGVYVKNESYVGADFWSKWQFQPFLEPERGHEHGHAEFVSDLAAARALGLVNATAGRVYLGADMAARAAGGRGRRSVRVRSRAAYHSGLFVVSLDHVPAGCGTWPALWMSGGDEGHPWPAWGEYDIIEGVHNNERVSTTLHTTGHCRQSRVVAGEDFGGQWGRAGATNCYINALGQYGNEGCRQSGPAASMGARFNAQGGGTYAAEWAPQHGHIQTWFWPRGEEPADLREGADGGNGTSPDTTSWGPPYSYFRLDPRSCPRGHFQNMRLVLELNFCGFWAAASYKLQCPAHARRMTCQELVSEHPEHFREAYWSIRRLDVYKWQRHAAPAQEEDAYLWRRHLSAQQKRMAAARARADAARQARRARPRDGGFMPGWAISFAILQTGLLAGIAAYLWHSHRDEIRRRKSQLLSPGRRGDSRTISRRSAAASPPPAACTPTRSPTVPFSPGQADILGVAPSAEVC